MAAVLRNIPSLAEGRLVLQTACLRPLSADRKLVLGVIPGLEGAYVATGGGRLGLMMGPAMAWLMSELITSGRHQRPARRVRPGPLLRVSESRLKPVLGVGNQPLVPSPLLSDSTIALVVYGVLLESRQVDMVNSGAEKMKRWGLTAVGGIGRLLAGLILFVLVATVASAIGLDDPRGGGGRPPLSGMLALLILTASVDRWRIPGLQIRAPRPDPTELRQSRDYFQWIQNHEETETRRSSSSQEDRGDGERR